MSSSTNLRKNQELPSSKERKRQRDGEHSTTPQATSSEDAEIHPRQPAAMMKTLAIPSQLRLAHPGVVHSVTTFGA